MKKKEKEPWQIAAARYCVENSEKGFAVEDLKKFIQSIYSVNEGHIYKFFEEEIQSPSGRQYSREQKGGYWIPPLDLVSKVTDYDELKEARKNAKEAKELAIVAIAISVEAAIVSIFVPIFVTQWVSQTVKLDETQLKQIELIIKN